MADHPTNLLRYLRPYRWKALWGFVCVAGYIGASLWTPSLIGRAIDALQDPSSTARTFVGIMGLYLATALAAFLVSIGMRRLMLGLANRVEHDIRRDIFAHLTGMDLAFFQRERTGDLMTKMTSDLSAVREMIGQGLLQGARMAIGFPLAFGIMFATNVQLALVVTALLPLVSLLFFFLIRWIHTYYDACQDQFSTISNFAQETFAGIRTIKGFALEPRQRDEFRQHNEEYIRRNMTLTRIEEPVWPFMMLLYWFAAMLLLLVAGHQIIDGTLKLSVFVKFQFYLLFLQWPMLALGWTANLFQRGRTSWARIRTILEAEPGIKPQGESYTLQEEKDQTWNSHIAFRDVCLRLNDRTLLDHINLEIPPGQCLAITGPTGSGKTLLISLLVRLMDVSEGSVRIGDRDVRSIPLDQLRRNVGLAPQEPFLFSDTLANNLALGLDPVDDALKQHEERIVRAATIARLSDEVERFPDHYRTLLGERGVTLSGGQRQRTAIGRALAREPQLLILDDVFSAVDTQTESRILEQLLPVLHGRTSILISHRVSTLRHADRIIVLNEGRIVQDGTHAELVRQPGYYRELDEVQRLESKLEEVG
jgi:ATP-binding cassette subfamily B multidrug efflux pump